MLTDVSALGEVVHATDDLPLMTLQIFAPGDREHAVGWLQSRADRRPPSLPA